MTQNDESGEWASEVDEDQRPLEAVDSSAQMIGLLALLGPPPRRVLDVGCGAGRVLVPLAEAGHDVTGIDRDAAMLQECRASLAGREARLIEADFRRDWPTDLGCFEAVCCLGNTFMTITDVDEAVGLLQRSAAALEDGGVFVMDDVPGQFWPEVTSGNWQAGLSEDGLMQMVWAEDDTVFELHRDDQVDEHDWSLRTPDRRLRLWTLGTLRLAARLAGLSAIERLDGSRLLIMRKAGD